MAKRLAFLVIVVVPCRFCSADVLTLSASSPTVIPGGSVTVSEKVTFDANDAALIGAGYNLGGFDIAMFYDSSRFTVSNVTLGPLVSGDFSGSFNTATAGQLTGSASSNSVGVPVTVGETDTLVTFVLTANNSAPAGNGILNLVPSIGLTQTDIVFLNPNTFATQNGTQTLPVTNGFDPGVDTTVTVVSNQSIPEPSPLVLSSVIVTVFFAVIARRRFRGRFANRGE
jgi:hypothetical protein